MLLAVAARRRLPAGRPRRRPTLRRRRLAPGRPLQRRGPGRPRRPATAADARPSTTRRRGSGSCAEVERTPTPEADGTATWSLSTLRKALRSAPDGLPAVSTYTLWQVLHEAGYSHQRTRTWCPTGTALRRRKAGAAVVTDPDAESKKS